MACNHSNRVEVTTMSDAFFQYLCLECGEVIQGQRVPDINPVSAYLEELETLRQLKTWEVLGGADGRFTNQ